MAKTIGIGYQNFEQLIQNDCFYVDKTGFIKEWWENKDIVTLITRPRRFGKTLAMSMTEQFFSIQYADRKDLFENFSIWKDEKYHQLQGTYPVIFLSFANIKGKSYEAAREGIIQVIIDLYGKHRFLLEGNSLNQQEKAYFDYVNPDMSDTMAAMSLHRLSICMYRYYGKRSLILLDEYDAPMQEAYVNGYWEELVCFTRGLFHATFKTNPYMERGLMTGITRVSKESVFSDLNNLEVVTTTSEKYETTFGFTEQEVFTAMDEYGLEEKKKVKEWYDGFIFGKCRDIYNPWSILNYFQKRRFMAYWANTSSNSLVGKLIREGSRNIKIITETLLEQKPFHTQIDEQVIFSQLGNTESAVWSFLLAVGYLRAESFMINERGKPEYDLKLTNKEVLLIFEQMIEAWFKENDSDSAYNNFITALLTENIDAMNTYMNKVALNTFSFFDIGKEPSKAEPEKFYHGFVLGLMVDLADRYVITSNRESGFGRYDVIMEPKSEKDNAIILEFKVYNPKKEKDLQDTLNSAIQQIEDKKYSAVLETKGIPAERIRKYGFAFKGKEVLIG